MKKFLQLFILILNLVYFAPNVEAVFLLDTGPGQNSQFGTTLNADQSLAEQFMINETYLISSMEGWIGSELGGSVSLALYGTTTVNSPGGYEIPDLNNVIFRDTFIVPRAENNIYADWRGISGLNLKIDPGKYWLAFEALSFNGAMSGDPTKSLIGSAYRSTIEPTYWNYSYVGDNPTPEGFRVEANRHVIPEPTTMLLFTSGLAGAALFRRKLQ